MPKPCEINVTSEILATAASSKGCARELLLKIAHKMEDDELLNSDFFESIAIKHYQISVGEHLYVVAVRYKMASRLRATVEIITPCH